MPTWLAITVGVCSVTLTILVLLIKAGFWAGMIESRKNGNGNGTGALRHAELISELRSIREDTRSMRTGLHNVNNAITGMSAVIEIIKTDYERRRR